MPPALVLGFSSGLPLLLVYATQSAWLTEAGVPLRTIALLSEVGLAYKLKFLWAPFLDRYDPPLIGRVLGRRRAWIVVTQIFVALCLAGVAFGDPAHELWWTIAFSLALGAGGATQDTVIDGWRVNVAPVDQQSVITSIAEVGWRVGNLVGGAGALYLADSVGWRWAYLCMACLMLPGAIAAVLAPEPPLDAKREAALAQGAKGPGFWATMVEPIHDLKRRLGPLTWPVLLLVGGFRMPGYVAATMAIPLFKSLHYSNSDIATVTKVFGFWVAISGTIVAGWLIQRIGLWPSLLIGTITGSASHLSLAYLAAHGDHGGGEFWLFALAVSVDAFAYAFASIILITYMSGLAASDHAASQFALLTSLCAFPGSVLAALSGFAIEAVGFQHFFELTSLIGAPVALLCLWVWRKQPDPLHPVLEAQPSSPA